MMASLALRVKFVDSNDVLGDSTTSTHKISKSGIARLHDLGSKGGTSRAKFYSIANGTAPSYGIRSPSGHTPT